MFTHNQVFFSYQMQSEETVEKSIIDDVDLIFMHDYQPIPTEFKKEMKSSAHLTALKASPTLRRCHVSIAQPGSCSPPNSASISLLLCTRQPGNRIIEIRLGQ